NVRGDLDPAHDAIDALLAGFPAGTVSGAPKVRAMEIIHELEPEKRGPSAGGVGYFSPDGSMDSCIVLRTALVKDGTMHVQAGAGIVADSEAAYEARECRAKAGALIAAAREAVARANEAGFKNVGALAHAIVDTIVDGYFPVLDHFADRVDEMEGRIYTSSTAGQIASLEEVLAMRRELTTLRRVLGPGREVLGTLVRRDLPFLSPDLMLYFQDVYDHSIRVVEETEALRDRLGMAIEAQMTVSSNQLNQTMRVMAAWSIILMAMAWVAGVYGMNFRVMPELQWRYGYYWALGVMAAVGTVLILYFRRQRWI
ncbi:MAG: chorismate-binding protein, partial [Gemmatimonadetes bacterium]|nr:chorismate-binding protein [Gemmatimonadota bacterium]